MRASKPFKNPATESEVYEYFMRLEPARRRRVPVRVGRLRVGNYRVLYPVDDSARQVADALGRNPGLNYSPP